MKKSNLITLISFITIIVFLILFMLFLKTPAENAKQTDIGNSEQADFIASPSQSIHHTLPDSSKTAKSSQRASETKNNNASNHKKIKMDDALFIGDSRTLGLSEYAGIKGADFFSNVGMSVYNIHKDTVSVPTVGKVTLTELLTNKNYGKIYIMLGINELGYHFDQTIGKYQELIAFIQTKQPAAIIFIEANLHVTKERSASDDVVNNPAIDKFNTTLSELVDGKTLFYLDANTLFDDSEGNLSSDKSEDTTHLYAKYYAEWGKWIITQSNILIGGNNLDRQK